ncbi:hypothetical protein H072_10801 [Dactylellina haptotyla CBS 200.50]|uniref:Nephrocystin 3-like N-terminal domain-containing protein n=1 Tax=Dactylellina haptotyla (strain CBS 200.50) TaxID=1284197 RepID=S8A3R8_DACHA|nr:hypothetical protein H072_10801 [Dactylellina haptotyla CBS 200.50]
MDKIIEGGEFEGVSSEVALNRSLQILRNIDIRAGSIGDLTLGAKDSFNDNRITNNITHNYYDRESGHEKKEKVNDTFQRYLELFRTTRPEEDQLLITNDNSPLPGTSKWILDVVDSEALLGGTESGYHLIRGSAGKGKTFLCIYIFEHFKQRLATLAFNGVTKFIIICFHCNGQNDDRKTSVPVLRSIIYQMLQQDQTFAKHCSTYLGLNGSSDIPLERLQILFRAMISDPERKPMIWLLDGFDECDSSCKTFLSHEIERLYAPDAPKMPAVSTIVFSRDNSGLRAAKLYDLDSEKGANSNIQNDIKRLISARISELVHIPEIQERETNEYIEIMLLDRSEGTFLWIGYAIKELRRSRTWVEFKTALELLPQGLNAIYDQIFSRFSDRDGRLIADILALVIFSFDRFRADCLGPALEALQEVKDDHNDRITPPTGITWDQLTAHGFALLCQESLLKKKGDLVTIVHQSLAEYFMPFQKNYTTSRPSFLNIRPSVCLLRTTLACLRILSQSPLSMFDKHSSFPLLTLEDYFAVYAFCFWIPHTRWLGESTPSNSYI